MARPRGRKTKETVKKDEIVENEEKNVDMKSKYAERLQKLQLKKNEAKNLNYQAVLNEDRLNNMDSNWQKRKMRAEKQLVELEERKAAKSQGKSYEKEKMLKETVADIEWKNAKKSRNNMMSGEGLSDFDNATFQKFNRNMKKFRPDLESYEKMKETMPDAGLYPTVNSVDFYSLAHTNTKERVDALHKDIEQQADKNHKYHRRRMFIEEKDINYINEKNRLFNKKSEKYYSKYTKDIKDSLERGTAL